MLLPSNNNKMSEGRQMGDFAQSNKNRQRAGKEMAPLIQKIEAEFTAVLSETRIVKEKASELARMEADRASLQRQLRELRRELHETNTHLAAVKAENELGMARQTAAHNTIKDQVQSLERTVARRDDYFQSYDRRLTNVAEAARVQQALVTDRLLAFEERLRQLSRDTVEAANQARQECNDSLSATKAIREQLGRKLAQTQEKERILDLYMAERHEVPRKLKDIHDHLATCLKQNDFHTFKDSHERAIQDTLAKAKAIIQQMVPPHTQQRLEDMQARLSLLDEIKQKLEGIDEVRQRVETFEGKLQAMERKEDKRMIDFREQAVQMEEKIIEVIDRKIENVQVEIQHIQVQQEDSIDEKLQKMKEELLSFLQQSHPTAISTSQPVLPVIDPNAFQEQLEEMRRERQLAEQRCAQIKQIGEGLNTKLSLFSNRITMCRSDIEIFMESAAKEFKKIADVRKEEEQHMAQVGRVLADLTESSIILASLLLSDDPQLEPKSFATFHDGIVLQLNKSMPGIINYRRIPCNSNDLKQSLLLALLNHVDNTTTNTTVLKWDQYRPSAFFSKVKEHLTVKEKKGFRSPSAHTRSPRRRKDEEDLLFDLKMESQELFKANHQKPKIVINNSAFLLTSQKPKSQMGMRYKLKKQEEMGKKQEERGGFYTSRSHRKAKIAYK